MLDALMLSLTFSPVAPASGKMRRDQLLRPPDLFSFFSAIIQNE